MTFFAYCICLLDGLFVRGMGGFVIALQGSVSRGEGALSTRQKELQAE